MIIALVLQLTLAGMEQDWAQCERQPDLSWCEAECRLDDWGSWCAAGLSVEDARRWDSQAKAAFRPRPDREDIWGSKAGRVLAGEWFTGDCDDLVSTVIDLWSRAGAQDHQMGRMVLDNPKPELGGDPQHMVATIEIDGVTYIAGDTYGPMRTLEASGYAPVWTNMISDGLKWVRAEPPQP